MDKENNTEEIVKKQVQTANKFYFITLIFLVLLLGYLSYQIFRPFLSPIFWAIVLSILFYPFYALILKYVKNKLIASLTTLTVIILIVVGPISYLSFLFVVELRALVGTVKGEMADIMENLLQLPFISYLIDRITVLFNVTGEELHVAIVDILMQVRNELLVRAPKLATDIVVGAINFMLMALSIFFILQEGPDFLKKARDYMPFSDKQKDRIEKQVNDIVVSTLYGGVVVAIVQGTLGGIAFAIVGVASPVFWGVVMAIASFLPVIGPFGIWAPASIYLLFTGEILRGIALIIMGVFGISLIDNFLRPLIIGARTKMPFILLFFSVLGGIMAFGFMGFIVGPLVLALFVSVIEVFRSTEGITEISKEFPTGSAGGNEGDM